MSAFTVLTLFFPGHIFLFVSVTNDPAFANIYISYMNISIPVHIVYKMSDHVYLANYIYTVYNYYNL